MRRKPDTSKKPSKALAAADAIEKELKRIGRWSQNPPTKAQMAQMGAFGIGTMPFCAWIQFVLLPRVREMVKNGEPFPSESNVGAQAVREFDGNVETAELTRLLIKFDSIFSS